MTTMNRCIVVVVVLSLFCVPVRVHALSAPPVLDIFAVPGEEQSVSVSVLNDSAKQNTIHFSFVHVGFDELGDPILESSAQDLSWIRIVEEQGIVLDAGETGEVHIAVEPELETRIGGYALALISTEAQEGSYVLTPGVATLVFVTVGAATPEAHCVTFVAQEHGTFLQTLRNDGQGILYDEGNVVLRGPFGVAYAKASSNPSHHRVFAGQTRTWTSEAIRVPWWAIGPLTFSLESDSFVSTCPRISAGFGWMPVAMIAAGGLGIFLARRRA